MSDENAARALWFAAPGRVEIRAERLAPRNGDALVRTLWSGVSRGTERLVLEGRVPEGERARMRAPFQRGDFPFPVKYGYAAVGVVQDGPHSLIGRRVFALHPHQTRFRVPADAVLPVPDAAPSRRAVLAANMETALNAVWDAGAAPGDRIAVIGAGALGLLVAAILSRLPGADVTVVDVLAHRRGIAGKLNVSFATPPSTPAGCDIAFHASASAAGLATAMAALGDGGTLVETSWHGAGETPVALGGAFHARRLRLISSQVGALPPARLPRWDRRRRLAKALELLADDRLDALIDAEIAFDDAPAALPRLLAPDAEGLAAAIRYED